MNPVSTQQHFTVEPDSPMPSVRIGGEGTCFVNVFAGWEHTLCLSGGPRTVADWWAAAADHVGQTVAELLNLHAEPSAERSVTFVSCPFCPAYWERGGPWTPAEADDLLSRHKARRHS